MACTADEKWSIDKLESSNWMTWRFQMRHLLLAKGLWGYVDGSEVLGENVTPRARDNFRKQSQRALSTIVMAVGTSQLYLITNCDQPKDAWDALKNHFERDTLANKLLLKKKYFRSEMKEGASMEAHLKYMKELTDKLAAIGAPIQEEDQVVTLLGSLPSSYSVLVTALESRADDVSLGYVQQALLHEKQKMKNDGDASGGKKSTALLHKEQARKVKCYGCHQFGHYKRDCPQKGKKEQKSKHSTNSVAEEVSGAFAAGGETQQDQRWLIDSGASSHMTNKREFLVNFQELEKPESVCLGDGRTVEAVGIGNVQLNLKFHVSEPKKCVMYEVLYVPKLSCNMFSVRAAVAKGNMVKFGGAKCWIRDARGTLLGVGSISNKLYQLHCEAVTHEHASVVTEESNADLWHQRLGHLKRHQLSELNLSEAVSGVKFSKRDTLTFCESCVEGKMQRRRFKPVGDIRSTRKLELVHSDVCGPMPVVDWRDEILRHFHR